MISWKRRFSYAKSISWKSDTIPMSIISYRRGELIMDLDAIQQALQSEHLDGWLFYDFRKSNPIAYQVLGLPFDAFYSRRWFYFIPAQGEPTAIVSAVESHVLGALPGHHLIFRTWGEMHERLQVLLRWRKRIAMEYSPMNAIPTMSRVDAGTL